ncbi:hypothetical protein Amsp01_087760 [Amycolatopsis sp. NBRC 101858]|uniref:hypothetical protein n=1 Tax=Amycolatopsis sp. NBRC 101858 TaxID=3032200 RepID=UPI0024A36AE4|nr:hypothetical protein [Amycolatopsis sp. NBRC 101858]GLY42753.1 hypothetical protein Amsp01_087760 [Amycolatopsis sp. NBRC 101858]
MTVQSHQADSITDEVSTWLTGEFASLLPATDITAIVRSARTDLEGQIVPEAMGEMLHRLARFRVLRTLQHA